MGNVLQGRTFGLPNVVLIGGAAVLIWFLFLRGKATGTKPAASSPSGQATTDYSLGYAQGLQANAPQQQQPKAGPAGPQTQVRIGNGYGVADGSLPNVVSSGGQSYAQVNQPYASLLAAGQGDKVFYQVAPGVFNPVTQQVAATGAANGAPLFLQQALGGAGGPARKHHIGSRSSHLWHDGHPLIGAPVQLPHYVRKVGGPSKTAAHHQAEVHRVAGQAGVHPARIMQLNPRPSSAFIRVA